MAVNNTWSILSSKVLVFFNWLCSIFFWDIQCPIIQLAKHPTSLNSAKIDGMYLSDIKKQVRLIKWCIVWLRHSNCLLYHEDIWSLEPAIMNTRSKCFFCNYEHTDRQGQFESSYWCHQQQSPSLSGCFGICRVVVSSESAWKEQSGGRKVAFKSKRQYRTKKVIGQEMVKDFPQKKRISSKWNYTQVVLTSTAGKHHQKEN